MKKLFSWLTTALVVLAAGCSESFDDSGIWNKLNEHSESIKDHEERILALEELCKQLNTNISALQTLVEALQERDYITAITPINKDGEIVGYTISFAQSDSITIYFDQSGNGGIAIQPKVPQIGVRQDSDGLYYWTVDGEWLLDEHGNKVKAVGEDGRDGENGEDGKDGITPRLKIENEYWYISYDEGKTWEELGKATGEDGKDGENADCIFRSITQDDEYVYFHLNDGTTIAIAKGGSSGSGDVVVSLDGYDCPSNEILYLANDGFSITPSVIDGYGAYFRSAVYENGVGRVKFSSTIRQIPGNAFSGEGTITEIKLPSMIEYIGSGAFQNCSNLRKINVPEQVTEIGSRAFYGCEHLSEITIPESVEEIGYGVLGRCPNLEQIRGRYASEDHRSLVVEGTLISIASAGLSRYTTPSDITKIGESSFDGCKSLQEINLSQNVTTIGDRAFSGCESLISLTLPDALTDIGDSAFTNCGQLKAFYGKYTTEDHRCIIMEEKLKAFAPAGLHDYTLPAECSIIDRYAFNSQELSCVTIPENISQIYSHAFAFCRSLTTIYCKSSNPPEAVTSGSTGSSAWFSASWDAFNINRSYLGTEIVIYVPTESVEAYKSAEGWNEYASSIVGYNF